MAFDPENHVIDPKTGFMVHKDGTHIVGLMPPLDKPKAFDDFPKWVVPHSSHVVIDPRSGDKIAPKFEYHVTRDKVLSVLVKDESEERLALSEAE